MITNDLLKRAIVVEILDGEIRNITSQTDVDLIVVDYDHQATDENLSFTDANGCPLAVYEFPADNFDQDAEYELAVILEKAEHRGLIEV